MGHSRVTCVVAVCLFTTPLLLHQEGYYHSVTKNYYIAYENYYKKKVLLQVFSTTILKTTIKSYYKTTTQSTLLYVETPLYYLSPPSCPGPPWLSSLSSVQELLWTISILGVGVVDKMLL